MCIINHLLVHHIILHNEILFCPSYLVLLFYFYCETIYSILLTTSHRSFIIEHCKCIIRSQTMSLFMIYIIAPLLMTYVNCDSVSVQLNGFPGVI